MIRKYQGEDINFSINIGLDTASSGIDFSTIKNAIVYMYTSDDAIQKFSIVEKDGHSQLVVVSDLEASGVISSEHTSLMSGQVVIEVMLEIDTTTGDNTSNIINKAQSGIIIVDSKIKESI